MKNTIIINTIQKYNNVIIILYMYNVITHARVIAGKSRILMLDAEERAAEFRSAAADDITMRQTAKNLHSCTTYEEGRLRIVQRIQGNFAGECRFCFGF